MTNGVKQMKTFLRYLMFQVPQWFILALFLWLLVDQNAVPLWVTRTFFIVWLVKDLAIYPWVRRAYETNAKTGTEVLVGAKAIAQERLDPEGYVKLRGELWKAQAYPSDQPIHRNSEVKVRAASGSTLIVSATE